MPLYYLAKMLYAATPHAHLQYLMNFSLSWELGQDIYFHSRLG